jgi:hypothetical protein
MPEGDGVVLCVKRLTDEEHGGGRMVDDPLSKWIVYFSLPSSGLGARTGRPRLRQSSGLAATNEAARVRAAPR